MLQLQFRYDEGRTYKAGGAYFQRGVKSYNRLRAYRFSLASGGGHSRVKASRMSIGESLGTESGCLAKVPESIIEE